MHIAFFGSSLVSAYWNGAATYYRGIVRALHERGHTITFYEPDAYDRQRHRDIPDPAWARVVVYGIEDDAQVMKCLEEAQHADLVIKTSGVGAYDELLEAAIADLKSPKRMVAFWDVDAPATLERVEANPSDPFRALIPQYDLIFTYGGGPMVYETYLALGAQNCHLIYNALDPTTHYPVPADPRFSGLCGFLGNRLPDREQRVEDFFLAPAAALPNERFLLGGNGWQDKTMTPNVHYLGHVYTQEHNAFNSSVQTVLNINRSSMARFGFSPPTRIFEAAGAGACLITDAWHGIETFLEPGREVLVANDGDAVIEHLRSLQLEQARQIGAAARRRVLAEHTYHQRATQIEQILMGTFDGQASLSQSQQKTTITDQP
jgi:spore maturation protein CgeB